MPLLDLSELNGKPQFIGETEFVAPDDEAEHVKLYIYLAQADFVDAALTADFGSNGENFIAMLKAYVLQHDAQEL